MSHEKRERLQQERRAEEFSVAIWQGSGMDKRNVFARCVGKGGTVKTMDDAAAWGVKRAKGLGLIKPGDQIEVDVSADASFDWFTVLKTTVE